MSDYLAGAYYYMKWKFQELLDENGSLLRNWPTAESLLPGSAIITAYIYFAKVAGPGFMSIRKPLYLREPMICYNFMMAILNLSLFLNFGHYSWLNQYNLYTKPVNAANQFNTLWMTQLNYIFYLSKFIQFSDTIFLILLKKESDLSAFHILQRTLTPFLHGFGMKYASEQQNSLFSLLNSFLHTIMYSYYGMKIMVPENKKILFYKKLIRNIQTVNFAIIIAHGASLYLRNTGAMHKYLSINFVPALLLLGLFMNLFFETYAKKLQGKESVIIFEETLSNEDTKKNRETNKRMRKGNNINSSLPESLEVGDTEKTCSFLKDL